MRAGLEWLPGAPTIGERVCLEIDATRPEHARPCGSPGELPMARRYWLIWGPILVLGTVVIAIQRRRSRGRAARAAAWPAGG